MIPRLKYFITLATILVSAESGAQTIALWTFDEQQGMYPSSVISDVSDSDFPLILGQGGRIVEGKYGNALEPAEADKLVYPKGEKRFGLKRLPVPKGRTVEPMTWMNAHFCALMTNGENHLRKDVAFPQITATGMNLGDVDWTVEFWYCPGTDNKEYGVVFEMGEGPRGENDHLTQLIVNPHQDGFTFINKPSEQRIYISSDLNPDNIWIHLAFVYSATDKQLRHYNNGKLVDLSVISGLKKLREGGEDYFTLGRNGFWEHPLPGRMDELRFSLGQVYKDDFTPPASFAPGINDQSRKPANEPETPLLFAQTMTGSDPVDLAGRKHLFIDDAFLESIQNCWFQANPPRPDVCVIDDIKGPFRKHVSVVEDENGLIRMYYGGADDVLEVRTSVDGIHWMIPEPESAENALRPGVAVPEPTAMGNVFPDPQAPPQERWKFVSDFNRRGIFLYSSADGFNFKRHRTAILPFRSGSQSNTFYDDQRGLYIGYHRSDFAATKTGSTQREFVMTTAADPAKPWPFTPVTPENYAMAAQTKSFRDPVPWYLDNGPLTPGGFSIEYPVVFAPDESMDPENTDVYVPKAMKYPWAPDVYVAFPLMYFHYEHSADIRRAILYEPSRMKGSGTVETQLAVSRDGLHWKRYPRPAYAGIGKYNGRNIHQAYLGYGMVKRGNEIWQYTFNESRYHSSWEKDDYYRQIYRLVQRFDGFVSLDTPYEKEGYIITRPFRFNGNRLVLNVDTDAAGYVQVGFLDEQGNIIKGYSVDECICINGDYMDTRVEWIQNTDELKEFGLINEEDYMAFSNKVISGMDVSVLEGRIVQLVFRMRGSKLYSMQFINE